MTNGTNTPQELDAWTMATSILSGVRKATKKAHEELEEVKAANIEATGRPFGNGIGSKYALIEALNTAEKSLVADLSQIARANNLPLPKD